jgi:N-acylneuraminate cytidylyltransferase
VVISEDPEVLEYARIIPGVEAVLRPSALARPNTPIGPTVLHVLEALRSQDGYAPDAVMLLQINAPLRRRQHIEKAIDAMLIFQTDSVVSVSEDLSFHYVHGRDGLVPLRPQRRLRLERDALYEENGAIYLSRREVVCAERFLGKRVGHILMTPEESVQIDGPYERWLVEQLFARREAAAVVAS